MLVPHRNSSGGSSGLLPRGESPCGTDEMCVLLTPCECFNKDFPKTALVPAELYYVFLTESLHIIKQEDTVLNFASIHSSLGVELQVNELAKPT